MPDLFSMLFDNDLRQRDDIDAATSAAEMAHTEVAQLRGRLERAEARGERLELVLEALLTWLELRGDLDRKELAVLIQRLDLADGFEDGRIGPDRARHAPKCASCGRPHNPRRSACLYCGAEAGAAPARDPAVPTVACRSCGTDVPENEVYFSSVGMICEACFRG